VKAVKCDSKKRVRIPFLQPGDWFEPEQVSADVVTLRRIPPPARPRKMSREECLAALAASDLRFETSFDELKKETR
jgi:hypothetical protein